MLQNVEGSAWQPIQKAISACALLCTIGVRTPLMPHEIDHVVVAQ